MKKVLFFLSGKSIHGGEKVDLAYGQLLEKEGYNVDYVEIGALLESISSKTGSRILVLVLVNFILFLQYFISNHRIIVITHYFSWVPFLLLVWSRVILRKRIVFILHHFKCRCPVKSLPHWSKIRLKEWIPLLVANRIIVNSHFSKEETEHIGISSKKVIVVYPLISKGSSIIKKTSISKTSIISILFVGVINKRKGVDILCEAFSQLPRANLRLNLVGNNTIWLDYLSLILSYLKDDKRIIMHGQLSNGDLSVLYKNSNIFVLPSYWEGFGIALVEAMRYGLPIISTNISAIPELIHNRRNGILVEPGNVEELRIALRTLIEDTQLREQYSQASYQKYNELSSWKDEAMKFVSCFNDL